MGERMTLSIERGVCQEAEETQAIVERDHDDRCPAWSPRSELAPVIVVGLAIDIAAPVVPHEDRKPPGTEPCREDIQIKAVLSDAGRSGKHAERRHLGAS